MPESANKQIVRRYIEVGFGQGDMQVIRDTVAPNYLRHGKGAVSSGGLDVEKVVEAFRAAFPDGYTKITHLIEDGDMMAVRVMSYGTHLGPYVGIEPTGKKIEFPAADFFRLENGKIVESWHNVDEMSLLRQLGAIA